MIEGQPKFEKEPPSERETGISRIVGASPEQEQEIIDYYKKLEFTETKKTMEETEIAEKILQRLPVFVRRYGGTPVALDIKKIHFINEGVDADEFRKAMHQDSEVEGFYSQQYQLAVVFKAKGDLNNAHSLVHELLHFNSFQSREAKNDSDTTKPRRDGFTITDKKGNVLFEDINEAVIERLAIQFDKENFSQIPCLAEATAEREEIKERLIKKNPDDKKFLENAAFLARVTEKEFDVTSNRDSEIEKLDKIIGRIYLDNKDTFASEEDVFNVFARAVMEGNLLPVARLIEKMDGKGSFRRLGRETQGSH